CACFGNSRLRYCDRSWNRYSDRNSGCHPCKKQAERCRIIDRFVEKDIPENGSKFMVGGRVQYFGNPACSRGAGTDRHRLEPSGRSGTYELEHDHCCDQCQVVKRIEPNELYEQENLWHLYDEQINQRLCLMQHLY